MGCGGELSRFGNRPGLIVVGQFSLSRPVGRLFALSQFGLFSFLSKGCASQDWEISLWKVVEKGRGSVGWCPGALRTALPDNPRLPIKSAVCPSESFYSTITSAAISNPLSA
jgi:hypothetical protein